MHLAQFNIRRNISLCGVSAMRLLSLLGLGIWWAVTGPVHGAEQDELPAVIGQWDVTVTHKTTTYPAWIEIRKSGYHTLVGSYVGQFGSARPIAKIEHRDGQIRFVVPPQWEKRETDVVFEGKLNGDVLRGEATGDQGETLRWEARRAPSLHRDEPTQWQEPMQLFNGKDLSGWKARFANQKHGWQVRDGLLANVEPGNDLMTEEQFEDFKLHAEFRYPKGSNSGIYLRGRYEVQIEDNYGREPESHLIGGVYGYLTPRVNSAKPAGEWQSIDITLVGRRVTVVLNGECIIDRQVIPGITGGALDSAEEKPGPLLLQGDHGPVEFRNITLAPAMR